MNNGAPYRASCPGWTDCTFGPLFQHGRAGYVVPKYKNNTAITGAPFDPVTGKSTINPLLGYSDCGATPLFSTPYNGSNYGIDGSGGPWLNADNTTIPANTYVADGSSTIDLGAACNLTGWKCVIAKRQWHGTPGFDDYITRGGGTILCGTRDWYGSGASWSYELPYQAMPPSTRYLTQQVVFTVNSKEEISDGNYTAECNISINYNQSINPQSGVVTTTGSVSGLNYQTTPSGTTYPGSLAGVYNDIGYVESMIASMLGMTANDSIYDLSATFSGAVEPWSLAFSPYAGTGATLNITAADFSATEIHIAATGVIVDSPPGGPTTTFTQSWDMKVTLGGANTSDDLISDAENNLLVTWNLADNLQYPPINADWNGITVLVMRNEVPQTVSLFEVMPSISPTTDGMGGWTQDINPTDANAAIYDGRIIGAPNTDCPANAYPEDYFDFYSVNWVEDDTCGNSCPNNYSNRSYGNWLSQANLGNTLPARATHWTNPRDCLFNNLSIGRLRSAGGNPLEAGDGYYFSKWAETTLRFPSYNHARPFGPDRYLIDETQVGCIQSGGISGSGPFTVLLSNTVTIPSGAHVILYGTGQDGVYSTTGGAATSSLSVTYLSALPAGYSYFDSGAGGIVGLLRYPNCPPMAGRLAVASVTDNHDGTVTVTTDPTPAPYDPAWPIDLTNGSMTALATNSAPHNAPAWAAATAYTVGQLVTDVNGYIQRCTTNGTSGGSSPAWVETSGGTTADNTVIWTCAGLNTKTFIITATFATVAGAKWLVLYGALAGETVSGVAHWYWDDMAPKGNFVLGSWTEDFRTGREIGRLGNPSSSPITDCNGGTEACPYSSGGQNYNSDGTPNYGYSAATFTDECKGFVACAPWLIVCSPNETDTPAAGTGLRFDFSAGITLDYLYGCRQIMIPMQAMTDPQWQNPHAPLCVGGSYSGCTPLVEARATLPYATSQTSPPDNGAGTGQNEAPPSFCPDYTILDPVTEAEGQGDPYNDCSGGDEPTSTHTTDGIYPGCTP